MNTEVKEEVKQELPEKIFAVNYAGYWELQDGEYYEDTKLLHEDEYTHAEKLAEETCKRYNSHSSLLEVNRQLLEALKAITSNKHIHLEDLIYKVREDEGEGWEGEQVKQWSDAIKKVKEAISKAETTIK